MRRTRDEAGERDGPVRVVAEVGSKSLTLEGGD